MQIEQLLVREIRKMRDLQGSSYSKVRKRLGLNNRNTLKEEVISNIYFLDKNFVSN